jgi:hypothetical protein
MWDLNRASGVPARHPEAGADAAATIERILVHGEPHPYPF